MKVQREGPIGLCSCRIFRPSAARPRHAGSAVRAQHLLDRAQHIDGIVAHRHELALRHIGADNKGDAAMGVHVVRPVLGVVLDDKNQDRLRVGAARELPE